MFVAVINLKMNDKITIVVLIIVLVNNGIDWHCHRILTHKRVYEDDSDYRNCPYNILVEWTDGQRSWEPANIFRGDTLEWMVGKYAYDNDLLHDKYWKRYNSLLQTLIATVRYTLQIVVYFADCCYY